jgi:hypothetical protein
MDERPITRTDLVELLSALRVELKADLAELRTEFKADLAELKTELQTDLKAKLAETKQEILDTTQEQVRDAQTEILKAFLPFREDTGIRFRAFDVKLSNTEAELRARMDVIEKRLWQIETKLLLEPPAA